MELTPEPDTPLDPRNISGQQPFLDIGHFHDGPTPYMVPPRTPRDETPLYDRNLGDDQGEGTPASLPTHPTPTNLPATPATPAPEDMPAYKGPDYETKLMFNKYAQPAVDEALRDLRNPPPAPPSAGDVARAVRDAVSESRHQDSIRENVGEASLGGPTAAESGFTRDFDTTGMIEPPDSVSKAEGTDTAAPNKNATPVDEPGVAGGGGDMPTDLPEPPVSANEEPEESAFLPFRQPFDGTQPEVTPAERETINQSISNIVDNALTTHAEKVYHHNPGGVLLPESSRLDLRHDLEDGDYIGISVVRSNEMGTRTITGSLRNDEDHSYVKSKAFFYLELPDGQEAKFIRTLEDPGLPASLSLQEVQRLASIIEAARPA